MNIKGPFVFWLPMVAIGMVNGLFRGLVLIRLFDETTAGQISSITLIILLAVYVGFIYTRLSIRSTSHALMIGTFWAFLTSYSKRRWDILVPVYQWIRSWLSTIFSKANFGHLFS